MIYVVLKGEIFTSKMPEYGNVKPVAADGGRQSCGNSKWVKIVGRNQAELRFTKTTANK